MDTSKPCVLERPSRSSRENAFSLVEVTLAIGIVAFAFISVFGLVPMGLSTFHHAMDASIGSQITQRMMNDAQQTDFSVLVSGTRYFDDQGTEIVPANPVSLTADEQRRVIYVANTHITPSTSIPGSLPSQKIANGNLATITVQIVNNPGNRPVRTDSSSQLWNDPNFTIATYSGLVSRNQ